MDETLAYYENNAEHLSSRYNTTQYDDFYEFINDKNYSMSYKMIMILSSLKIVDHNGVVIIALWHGKDK